MYLLIMRSAHPHLAKPEGRERGREGERERERGEDAYLLGGGSNGQTRMYESRRTSRMFTW